MKTKYSNQHKKVLRTIFKKKDMNTLKELQDLMSLYSFSAREILMLTSCFLARQERLTGGFNAIWYHVERANANRNRREHPSV